MQEVGYILYNDEPAALTGNTTDTVGHSKGVIGWTEVSIFNFLKKIKMDVFLRR